MQKKSTFNLLSQQNKNKSSKNQILIQLPSNQVSIDIFQLFKYSQFIQNEYSIQNIKELFPQDIIQIINKKKIKEESIVTFFTLLSDQNAEISNENYVDLVKLSGLFEVEPLQGLLNEYQKEHVADIDLIINMLIENKDDSTYNDKISSTMEGVLINQVDNLLQNVNFDKLHISTIYRIIERSDSKFNSNILYDFIMKSLNNRYILLKFLKLQELSSEKINDLYEKLHLSQDSKIYEQYLPSGLYSISELRSEIKSKEKQLQEQKNKIDDFEKKCKFLNEKIEELESKNQELTTNKSQTEKEISADIERIKEENELLRKKALEIQDQNNQLKTHIEQMFSKNIKTKEERQKDANKTDDIEYKLDVSLCDLYNGCDKSIEVIRKVICPKCKGSGCKEGIKPKVCPKCGGQKKIFEAIRKGQMFKQVVKECPTCHGLPSYIEDKNKCLTCSGNDLVNEKKKIEVKINPGLDDGDEIKFEGLADESLLKKPGDLYVVLKLKEDDHFLRRNDNLLITQTIALSESFLGTTFVVTHLDGRKLIISTPKGQYISPNSLKIIKNEGMPTKENVFKKGDLFIKFVVEYPISRNLPESFTQELLKCSPLPKRLEGVQFDELAHEYTLDKSDADIWQFNYSNEKQDENETQEPTESCQPM